MDPASPPLPTLKMSMAVCCTHSCAVVGGVGVAVAVAVGVGVGGVGGFVVLVVHHGAAVVVAACLVRDL